MIGGPVARNPGKVIIFGGKYANGSRVQPQSAVHAATYEDYSHGVRMIRPDMIVGDMDSASEPTLKCGAELVVHAYTDGTAPGRDLLESLGVPYKTVAAPGTSQDIAMLIAAEKGADLIVSVGSQFNLVEFLDKNRRGMSSTFLTRLRLGEILVDAKGVSRLYRPQPGIGPVLFVAVVGFIALLGVVLVTPGLKEVADLLWLKLQLLLGLNP